eukprot:TRINITY_DN17266_c0_g1_i1.p1 TRINITY_DN17266_c0_g1~~TRINITY_DN17266_c0_g1_i1.p1  ORF type:complete len:294 (+),score=42.80 TRINITY_DN17266_c0_g1_i1:117-998(+)
MSRRTVSPIRQRYRPVEYVSPHHVRAVDSLMKIQHLEHSIEGLFIEEAITRAMSTPRGHQQSLMHVGYGRSPGRLNSISQDIDSPVYDYQDRGYSPSPQRLQTPGSPIETAPRRIDDMVGQWKARASQLNSDIQKHKHDIVSNRPHVGRIGSGSAEAVNAPPSVAVSVPTSVHTNDIADIVGIDDLQKEVISIIDAKRSPDNPIRYDYLCNHTASAIAAALASGDDLPNVEGVTHFIHSGPVTTLTDNLPPELSSGSTHIGAAPSADGVVLCYTASSDASPDVIADNTAPEDG